MLQISPQWIESVLPLHQSLQQNSYPVPVVIPRETENLKLFQLQHKMVFCLFYLTSMLSYPAIFPFAIFFHQCNHQLILEYLTYLSSDCHPLLTSKFSVAISQLGYFLREKKKRLIVHFHFLKLLQESCHVLFISVSRAYHRPSAQEILNASSMNENIRTRVSGQMHVPMKNCVAQCYLPYQNSHKNKYTKVLISASLGC